MSSNQHLRELSPPAFLENPGVDFDSDSQPDMKVQMKSYHRFLQMDLREKSDWERDEEGKQEGAVYVRESVGRDKELQ